MVGEARCVLDDDLASPIAQEYRDPPYDTEPLVERLAHCQAALDSYADDPISGSWFKGSTRVLRDGKR